MCSARARTPSPRPSTPPLRTPRGPPAFDTPAEARAGLETLVRGAARRGAAVPAGCPARLVDAERHVRVRMEPDGRRHDTGPPPDPARPCAALVPGGAPALWLERAGGGEPSVVGAVVPERAAGALRAVPDRTRGRASLSPPPTTRRSSRPSSPPPPANGPACTRPGASARTPQRPRPAPWPRWAAAPVDPACARGPRPRGRTARRAGAAPLHPALALRHLARGGG